MTVNTAYINNATDIFDRMARFSSETGFIFGHCLVLLVAIYAGYKASIYGTSAAVAYGLLFGFITAFFLWLAGWESGSTLVFLGSALCLVILVTFLDSTS